MPDIDSPQARRIANEEVRKVADQLVSCYLTCKQFDLRRIASDYGSTFPNTVDPVIDGAAVDGRPVMLGVHANYVMARSAEIVAFFEEGGNGRLNTVLAVAVNGRSTLT